MGIAGTVDQAVASVFISEELKRRAPKNLDYFKQKVALQELATRMAGEPNEVLPKFVDLAMELTGGVSAGLSLYEETPAPGVSLAAPSRLSREVRGEHHTPQL